MSSSHRHERPHEQREREREHEHGHRGHSPERSDDRHHRRPTHSSRAHDRSPEALRSHTHRPQQQPPVASASPRSRRPASPQSQHNASHRHGRTDVSHPAWPPRPRVEDAAKAERHIVGVVSSYDDTPPCRGSVDQESVLEDVIPKVSRPATGAQHDARNSKIARAKRDSKLDADRFSFTPTASDISTTSTNESGYHSTEKAGVPRKTSGASTLSGSTIRGEDRRHQGKAGDGLDFKQTSSQNRVLHQTSCHDSSDDASSAASTREPARYAGAGAGTREVITPRPDSRLDAWSGLRSRVEDSSHPNSQFPNVTPRPRFDDASRSSSQPQRDFPTGALQSQMRDSGRTAFGDGARSRGQQPPSSSYGRASANNSPPDSPHHSGAENATPRSGRSSLSSRSRPGSPTPGQFLRRQDDGGRRASTFPVLLDDRSQKISRLAMPSIISANLPSPGSSQRSSLPYPVDNLPYPTSNLPYPVGDAVVMPSETDFAYRPPTPNDESLSHRRPHDAVQPGHPSFDRDTSTARPRMSSRRTLDETSMAPHSMPPSPSTWHDTPTAPSIRQKNSGHTACLVRPGKDDFHEWYCLPGTPIVHICPFCIDTKIAPSVFASKLEPTQRVHAEPSIRCCFDSKWTNLAWDISLDERREDLHLLASIARMDRDALVDHHAHLCPGSASRAGTWITVKTRSGEPPIPFFICPLDARKLGKLLPTLKHELDECHTRRKETCALSQECARFDKYIAPLVRADLEAHRKQRRPDLARFAQLARVLAEVPPCGRDNFVREGRWHYSPHAPAFTVCAECYATVVWPHVEAGSGVARRIADTEQAVEREQHPGHTCQLWSARMLAVFQRAVRDNDFKLLAEKAEARAAAERRLKLQWLDLDRRAAAVELEHSSAPKEREARTHELQRARHDLVAEWRRYE